MSFELNVLLILGQRIKPLLDVLNELDVGHDMSFRATRSASRVRVPSAWYTTL
jgi:hypothetical protein